MLESLDHVHAVTMPVWAVDAGELTILNTESSRDVSDLPTLKFALRPCPRKLLNGPAILALGIANQPCPFHLPGSRKRISTEGFYQVAGKMWRRFYRFQGARMETTEAVMGEAFPEGIPYST